ncbi:MAG TPA: D-isomer specific 2-hydroxyacid dehydrogenase family protein [Solirubrobacteraceae bacterium]|nr:D-isomer specific 2-hydroxyacid dehydrogenase family protein [Solirubrobacteraceae bacterium]
MPPTVHVGPEPDGTVEAAIREAGGEIAPLAEADGLVWVDSNPDSLPEELPEGVRWVQLPSAGVERWLDRLDRDRQWTTAAPAFGRTVAEHALTLMLAGTRRLHEFARARTWTRPPIAELAGSTVVIVGTGSIGRALIELLEPFRAEVLAVTRRGRDGTLPVERLGEVLPRADFVVIAAPSTDATRHLIGADELAAMRADAWLVNVARGALVDTEALVTALAEGSIAGAALDVTDPEPLPDGHPLWSEPRALLTPHVATPDTTLMSDLAWLAGEQVKRLVAGEPLLSPVDFDAGY